MKNKLSETLKKLREDSNMTQAQISELLNLDRSTYACYERGITTPSITSLINLSRLYGVSLDFLILGPKLLREDEDTFHINTLGPNKEM